MYLKNRINKWDVLVLVFNYIEENSVHFFSQYSFVLWNNIPVCKKDDHLKGCAE